MMHKSSNAQIVNIISQKYLQIYPACPCASQNWWCGLSQKKPPWIFFDIFCNPFIKHCRHEKRCQMCVRLFCLFQCPRNQQWRHSFLCSPNPFQCSSIWCRLHFLYGRVSIIGYWRKQSINQALLVFSILHWLNCKLLWANWTKTICIFVDFSRKTSLWYNFLKFSEFFLKIFVSLFTSQQQFSGIPPSFEIW